MKFSKDIEKLIISHTDPIIYRYMTELDIKNYPICNLYQMISDYSKILALKFREDCDIKSFSKKEKKELTLKIFEIFESWKLIETRTNLQNKTIFYAVEIKFLENINLYSEMWIDKPNPLALWSIYAKTNYIGKYGHLLRYYDRLIFRYSDDKLTDMPYRELNITNNNYLFDLIYKLLKI